MPRAHVFIREIGAIRGFILFLNVSDAWLVAKSKNLFATLHGP
jgi:hypothetical protein